MHRVVVIDDYEPSLQMYSAVIEKLLGGEVVTFTDPREALHYVMGMQPTLLVVDYNMPDMDGVALVTEIHGIPGRERLPVIMLTGQDDREVRNRALKAGVNVFLAKPVGAEEFASHVRRLSSAQNERQEKAEETKELRQRAEGADRRVAMRDKDALLALFRAYEARDAEAARRMNLVGEITVLLAIALRANAHDVQMLRDCAFIYDIGKLSIPEKILGTPSRLSAQSTALVEKHCEVGETILNISDSKLFGLARAISRQHHERFDGQGYPRKLQGEGISLAARMVAVADALVAMTHPRADRPAMPFGHALDQIRRESGTHFDPGVVSALDRIKDQVALLKPDAR
jgi:putative two-component system response regulator